MGSKIQQFFMLLHRALQFMVEKVRTHHSKFYLRFNAEYLQPTKAAKWGLSNATIPTSSIQLPRRSALTKPVLDTQNVSYLAQQKERDRPGTCVYLIYGRNTKNITRLCWSLSSLSTSLLWHGMTMSWFFSFLPVFISSSSFQSLSLFEFITRTL